MREAVDGGGCGLGVVQWLEHSSSVEEAVGSICSTEGEKVVVHY